MPVSYIRNSIHNTTICMHTINTSLISTLKEKVLWYTLDGEEGIILENDGKEFFPFNKLTLEQAENLLSGEIDYFCALQDGFHFDSYEKGLALEYGGITNPENDQKILYNTYSLAGCIGADRFERQFIRTGGQFHDWTGTPLLEYSKEEDYTIVNRDTLAEARKAYTALTEKEKECVDLGEFLELITGKESDLEAIISQTFTS